jgi:hypothetical protein
VYTQLLDGKQRFYVIEGVGECLSLDWMFRATSCNSLMQNHIVYNWYCLGFSDTAHTYVMISASFSSILSFSLSSFSRMPSFNVLVHSPLLAFSSKQPQFKLYFYPFKWDLKERSREYPEFEWFRMIENLSAVIRAEHRGQSVSCRIPVTTSGLQMKQQFCSAAPV